MQLSFIYTKWRGWAKRVLQCDAMHNTFYIIQIGFPTLFWKQTPVGMRPYAFKHHEQSYKQLIALRVIDKLDVADE